MKFITFLIIAVAIFSYLISCPNVAVFEVCLPTYTWQFTMGKQVDYFDYLSLFSFSCLLSFFATALIFSLFSNLEKRRQDSIKDFEERRKLKHR